MTEKIYCERCEQLLNPKKLVMLELNFRDNTWHPEGTVAEEDSQGCFPFGAGCARAALAESKEEEK